MPVTALLLPDPKKGEGVFKKIKFITQDFAVNLSVDIYPCDDNWVPYGQPTQGTHTDDEEKYHKDLRSETAKRGHFIPEQSTDPEWNPGYVAPEEPQNMAPDPDEFENHEPHTEM